MEENKISIALVEDHYEFRESMASLINLSKQYSCMKFSNSIDFLNFIKKKKKCHEIILMDINLPDIDGIECTRQVKEIFPESLIMMCTVYEDDEKIFNALKAGASGYMLKRAAIEEIFASLEDLLAGGSPMSSVIARKVVASFAKRDMMYRNDYNLSVRESEILGLLAKGLRLKEIADELFITINTVRTHIRHIYEKLQVQSRIEALNKTRHNFL
ncbi:MAG: response regulator transcription factor [Bacteroidetes bacterium]|nr:response regulator transcription factor [Bacteroidota bacterium]